MYCFAGTLSIYFITPKFVFTCIFQPGNSWIKTIKRFSVMPCRVTRSTETNEDKMPFKHWVLLLADSRHHEIRLFDSLGGDLSSWIYPLLKKHTDFDLSDWTFRPSEEQDQYVVKQKDGYSCGIHVAMNFDCFMRFKKYGERVSEVRNELSDLMEYKKQKFVAYMRKVTIVEPKGQTKVTSQTCSVVSNGCKHQAPRKDISNCSPAPVHKDESDSDSDCVFLSESESKSKSCEPPKKDLYSVPRELLDSVSDHEYGLGALTPPPSSITASAPLFDDELPDIFPIKRNRLARRKCADCPSTPVVVTKKSRKCKK